MFNELSDKPLAVLGIDPGHDGGLALLNIEADNVFVRVMPKHKAQIIGYRGRKAIKSKTSIDVSGLVTWIRSCQMQYDVSLCALESVHSISGQGITSAFSFGKGYGEVIGVLTALDIDVRYVEPQVWKQVILPNTEKDKQAAISWCQQTYPNVNLLMTPRAKVPHDGVADALCICEYGRRLLSGSMNYG